MDRKIEQESAFAKGNHNKPSYLIFKRIFDILVSFTLLILFTPIFLLLMILILKMDGPPIFFKQIRTGRNHIPFVIWKFRTMRNDSHSPVLFDFEKWGEGIPDEFIFKSEMSQNVTKTGKFLRKYSLDELPQLFNVLKGDMSIVGPRPESSEFTKFYIETQSKRLLVKPGLTGFAQINGRSEINHGQKIAYDLYYVKQCSLLLDVKIIMKTFIQVIRGKGAY